MSNPMEYLAIIIPVFTFVCCAVIEIVCKIKRKDS